MKIKVSLAKAHQAQLEDAEIKRELCNIEEEINKVDLPFQEGTINFVFIKGIYLQKERKMLTVCLFANIMDKPIKELHGVLRLGFKTRNAQIAKATVDFDEAFLGVINPNEALLVHIGIPVKGLSEDESFSISDISGDFGDVRVTLA